jgi:hypothetical protein
MEITTSSGSDFGTIIADGTSWDPASSDVSYIDASNSGIRVVDGTVETEATVDAGGDVYIFTETDASNINGMPQFNGTVTAGTAYMFDEGDRDALLVEVVLNDITSEPTDDYIVVDDGGAVIGLNDLIPNDAINGLKYYLEGVTPVGFVPDLETSRSDAVRNTDPQASISPTEADGIRVEGGGVQFASVDGEGVVTWADAGDDDIDDSTFYPDAICFSWRDRCLRISISHSIRSRSFQVRNKPYGSDAFEIIL